MFMVRIGQLSAWMAFWTGRLHCNKRASIATLSLLVGAPACTNYPRSQYHKRSDSCLILSLDIVYHGPAENCRSCSCFCKAWAAKSAMQKACLAHPCDHDERLDGDRDLGAGMVNHRVPNWRVPVRQCTLMCNQPLSRAQSLGLVEITASIWHQRCASVM